MQRKKRKLFTFEKEKRKKLLISIGIYGTMIIFE